MLEGYATPEDAALGEALPATEARIRASAISPDGQAAIVVLGLGAPDYRYMWESVCFRQDDGSWLAGGGGNGSGWRRTHDDGERYGPGVLTVWGEAPAGTTGAVISYQATEHSVTVRDGFFYLALWDEPPPPDDPEDPSIAPWRIRFT